MINKEINSVKKYLNTELLPHFPLYMNSIHILDLRPREIKPTKKGKNGIELIPYRKKQSLLKMKESFYKPISRLLY